jgi:hypothetical protein
MSSIWHRSFSRVVSAGQNARIDNTQREGENPMREFDPIDTSRSEVIAAGKPEPVLDFDTGQPKMGRDGKAISTVSTVAFEPEGAKVRQIKVSGEPPKGIVRGTPLRIEGLRVVYWEVAGRAGRSYEADLVAAITPAKAAS